MPASPPGAGTHLEETMKHGFNLSHIQDGEIKTTSNPAPDTWREGLWDEIKRISDKIKGSK